MSAVPALRPQPRPQTRSLPDPIALPRVAPRARPRLRPRVVEKQRTQVGAFVAVRGLIFAFLVGGTYFASALGGQVMVEKARREAIRVGDRTRASLSALEPLKAGIRRAEDGLEIQKWALENGFVAPEWAAAPSSQESKVDTKKAVH